MFFIFWSLAMVCSGFLWSYILAGKDLSDKECRYAFFGLLLTIVIALCSFPH